MPPRYNPFLSFYQVQNFIGLMKISMTILNIIHHEIWGCYSDWCWEFILWVVMWCFVNGHVFPVYLFFDCWNLKKHQEPLTHWYKITFHKTLLKILNSLFSHFSKTLYETMQYTFITTFFNWILVQSTAMTIASVNSLR